MVKKSKYGQLRAKGWGPWRSHWWDICSKHRGYESTCNLCQHGVWTLDIIHEIDSWLYHNWVDFWYFRHNRHDPECTWKNFLLGKVKHPWKKEDRP